MKREIKDIGDFIFINDPIKEADVIFLPGSSKWEVSEKAAELYGLGKANFILPAGKYSSKLGHFANERICDSKYAGSFEYDAEFCRHVLRKNGVPDTAILCEIESTNTLENALYSKQVLERYGQKVSSAIICCQAFHARRALMTYGLIFPDVEIQVAPAVTQGISKETWFESDLGKNLVMGEFERIGKYSKSYYAQVIL